MALLLTQYVGGDPTNNPPFKAEATVSTDYQDISTPDNWLKQWNILLVDYMTMRNNLIATYITPGTFWGTTTDTEKRALIKRFVWPDGTPNGELDALYTPTERRQFQDETMAWLGTYIVIRKSTTPGSVKYFDLSMEDDEVLNTRLIRTYSEIG